MAVGDAIAVFVGVAVGVVVGEGDAVDVAVADGLAVGGGGGAPCSSETEST